MKVKYAFLALAGVILLVLPVAVPVVKTSAEFSMFNTDWDGCSEFAKILYEKGKLVPIIYSYNSSSIEKLEGVLIIVGPNMDLSLDAGAVKGFLMNGGTLLLADDFGTANSLLEELNLGIRFSQEPLMDIFYSKRSEFPVIVRIEDPKLALGVDKVVLNVPSALLGGNGVLFSSKVSVVGKNMNSYPVMAEVKYGDGRIILLLDPSILINDMFQENRQFIENLIEYLGGKTFYFDEAHHSDFNPYLVTTVYVQRTFDRRRSFTVLLMVAVLSVLVEGGYLKRLSLSALGVFNSLFSKEQELLKDLPEWVDKGNLEKMLNEIKTGSKLGDTYEG